MRTQTILGNVQELELGGDAQTITATALDLAGEADLERLVDAAHIMADAHELRGRTITVNGIAVSKIHHAAFDNHLIGIDPDGRVHVSERLLMLHDGPLLEQSLKAIAGTSIRLPRSEQHRPDRDRLAIRFEEFKRVA